MRVLEWGGRRSAIRNRQVGGDNTARRCGRVLQRLLEELNMYPRNCHPGAQRRVRVQGSGPTLIGLFICYLLLYRPVI